MGAITEGEWRYNQLIKQFPSEPEPAFEDDEQLDALVGPSSGAAPTTSAGCGRC